MALNEKDGRKRVVIEAITPSVDDGLFAAKRTVGDLVEVQADIFTDGHDAISAVLMVRRDASSAWVEVPMIALVNDRWTASFRVTEIGLYSFKVEGWVDHFLTWHRDLLKRITAETDADVDYMIGAEMLLGAAERAGGTTSEAFNRKDGLWLTERAQLLRGSDVLKRRADATEAAVLTTMLRYPDRRFSTESDHEYGLTVDPVIARFSAWYEFFPRSTSAEPGKHGTFADCERMLPYVSSMGFNVVYMPPIHPIGVNFRKGRNNNPVSEAGDYGSPWAIGAAEGGHKAIHPELGTLADFRSFVRAAKELDLSLALDIAFQAAPDHPYVKAHENWFKKRPDGTIQYAENPPKKYQDIYPFDFESEDWQGMWQELKSVFDYWIGEGISIFRVDNPHTKAFPFWTWVIPAIKREHPEVLFLAEAFTRPKIMYRLAKVGFSQSYTYFPWRNEKTEIAAYLTELAQAPVRDFFRANQWPNTPDILTEFLQRGGRAIYGIRLMLAATLGANYGIYGPAFELMENRAVRVGGEDYLDSEKYEVRAWDLERADSLRPLIARINEIRNDNEALQNDSSILFHFSENDQLICYTKESPDGRNLILVVVNLDANNTQSGFVTLPLDALKIAHDEAFEVEDLLTGARYRWNGPRNYVALNPTDLPGHILRVERNVTTEGEPIL